MLTSRVFALAINYLTFIEGYPTQHKPENNRRLEAQAISFESVHVSLLGKDDIPSSSYNFPSKLNENKWNDYRDAHGVLNVSSTIYKSGVKIKGLSRAKRRIDPETDAQIKQPTHDFLPDPNIVPFLPDTMCALCKKKSDIPCITRMCLGIGITAKSMLAR